VALNLTAAYPVVEASQVAEPRRAAVALAGRLGFPEEQTGRLALVVTELATNLAKHATGGELLLRGIRDESSDAEPDGVEVLTIDAGPGIQNVALSSRDGHSTTGTLGHGLGAIERQADFFQLYTAAGGTIALARVWRRPTAPVPRLPRYQVGAIHVSKAGENVCGDCWDWRMREERLSVIVADGLGHGAAAHEAAREAIATFRREHELAPARVIEDIHGALRATRGAAVSMIAVDPERRVAKYSGVGNISAVVLNPNGTRQSLVSQNGTAGHTIPRLQEYNYPVPPQSMLVMYSDGLGTHWDLASYPGLRGRHPSVIAATLYRDFSRKRDDVTVIVIKERQPR
jgi:anti-sigma regulatory factor (Ser/Thr protein kinase)